MGNTEEGKNDSIGEDGKNVRSEDRNGIPEEQIDILQQAVKIRPRDPEAYLSLLRWLSSDGVLTQYEKEVMENFLYENGYPGKMREWRPAKYAGLEMELGKVYFGCYEGGTEAALRAFGNAAEAAGIGSRDRKFARAMCEVLGGEWTAGRVGAWEFLIEAAVAEAMKTGDGRFAASVCSRAAGEIALFPDRLAAAGADREDVREVADEVRKFAQALEDGWPEVPDETASELQTAAEAAVRVCSGGFWELPAEG